MEEQQEEDKIESVEESTDKEQLDEYKNKYWSLLAEMENTRKRLQKEKQEMTRFAIENVLNEILLPIDNLENALKSAEKMSEEVRNWAIGFEMILTQFKDVLSDHGVAPFHSEGNLFDPHSHEAVEAEETDDHPDGTILKEFVKGYRCGDRIVRAAQVKVAKAPKLEEEENLDNNQGDEDE